MDVLGADRDVRIALRQRVADRGEADERRADHPDHARDPGPRRDRPRQVARVGRGRVHLPVAGHDDVAHQPNHARAGCGREPAGSASRVARRSSRSSARWTAERWISSRSASSARLASGVSRRASATSRTTYGCFGEAPVGLERRDRIELAAGGADRALEVRRLGVEDAVELAAQGPRDLARLDLEQGARCPDPAQERADRLPVLGGHHAPPAAEAPRHGQPELGQPGGQLRRRSRLDDELEMGPPAGQAERAAGQEPAAQPGGVAVVRRRSPRRTAAPALPSPRPPAGGARGGRRRPRAGRCRAQAVDLGHAVAGARRVDGRQFVAQRGDEVPLGPGHAAPPPPRGPSTAADLRRSGSPCDRPSGAGSRPRPRRRG